MWFERPQSFYEGNKHPNLKKIASTSKVRNIENILPFI